MIAAGDGLLTEASAQATASRREQQSKKQLAMKNKQERRRTNKQQTINKRKDNTPHTYSNTNPHSHTPPPFVFGAGFSWFFLLGVSMALLMI